MRILWEASGDYDEFATVDRAGIDVVRDAVKDAFDRVPREHLRLLEGVVALDIDPKGKSLGIYARDHTGNRVELYLAPHVLDAIRAPVPARLWVLRLHIAHTLFHEIGHHLTLTLNRRTEPSKRRADVSATLEKWAEQYVDKRMQKFCDTLTAPGGAAEFDRAAFDTAVAFLWPPAKDGVPLRVSKSLRD